MIVLHPEVLRPGVLLPEVLLPAGQHVEDGDVNPQWGHGGDSNLSHLIELKVIVDNILKNNKTINNNQ